MKEFIEKLIARLEEVSIPIFDEDTEMESKVIFTDISKNIANQLAEEYKQCTLCYLQSPCEYQNEDAKLQDELLADKNGWIPCSERLPEIDGNTSDTVLVCTIDGFQHMAFWCADEKWRYCESGMIKNPMEWAEIIAWQPLPEPYKPKAEQALKQMGE